MPDTGILGEQDECAPLPLNVCLGLSLGLSQKCVFLSLSVSSLNVFGLCSLKCVSPICMVLLLVSCLCLIFFFVPECGLCLVLALPDLALLSFCVSVSHLGVLYSFLVLPTSLFFSL